MPTALQICTEDNACVEPVTLANQILHVIHVSVRLVMHIFKLSLDVLVTYVLRFKESSTFAAAVPYRSKFGHRY